MLCVKEESDRNGGPKETDASPKPPHGDHTRDSWVASSEILMPIQVCIKHMALSNLRLPVCEIAL